jgi:hypothetical protein
VVTSCQNVQNTEIEDEAGRQVSINGVKIATEEVDTLLDGWHKDAATGRFQNYFAVCSDNFHFLGTDATEDWSKEEFMSFSKPYFEDGEAWTFKPIKRNVYVNGNYAWFDEILDSDHMGLCRGSGVVSVENDSLLIEHYVLSILVPNDQVQSLMELKQSSDAAFVKKLDVNQ